MPKRLQAEHHSALLARRARVTSAALHVTGITLTSVSLAMLLCAVVELATTNTDTLALALSGLAASALGGVLWYFTSSGEPRNHQVFTTVGWTWAATMLVGCLPFVLAGTFAVSGAGLVDQIVNSLFESASGYSGTGATALVDFSSPGRGLMMYRQVTQWYGGMGVVVLAVAVLPFLGVGGLELIAAEAPGPHSDRLAPRVSETARRLWGVYIGLTAAAALVLFAVPGPSLYDSVAHALTLASNGGFSPYASSIGHFQSPWVEAVVVPFMILGGASFSLHWRALTGRVWIHWRDSEFRSYMGVLAVACVLVVALLWLEDGLELGSALRAGVFNTVSLGTSTGYGNATGPGTAGDYVIWAAGAQFVLLFLMIVGGCTGSTAGGMKIMRMQVLGIVAVRSVGFARSPNAVRIVRLGRVTIREEVVTRVVGFFLLHLLLLLAGLLVLSALGAQLETALGAVVSALGNMGPALGEAGPTGSYSEAFSQPARLVLALLMVVGRLEIMSLMLIAVLSLRRLGSLIAR